MTLETRNKIISVVLGIIIVILGWILVQSIVEPYKVVEQREATTEKVRYQMEDIRDGMVRYNRQYEYFPPTEGGLDSLVQFLKTDSMMVAQRDSIFQDEPGGYTFKLDSLIYSKREPHKRFEYTLLDTLTPPIYLLQDPDSDDKIGSLEKTTLLNAPSWK